MKKSIVTGIVVLCVAVGYYAFSYLEVDRKESLTLLSVATLDGNSITEPELLNNVPTFLYAVDASPTDIQRLKLAYYIQEELFSRLAAEFKIDISNEAIISYVNKEFDHVFNPTDAQINLTNVLIQALREVVENKRPIEAVYNDFFRHKVFMNGEKVTLKAWEGSVKNLGSLEGIEALEYNLSKQKKGERIGKVEDYRSLYIEHALRQAFCNQKNIKIELAKKIDISVVTKSERYRAQLFKQECSLLFYPWLLNEVSSRVKIIDEHYQGFEKYLSAYRNVEFIKVNERKRVKHKLQ